MEAKIDRHKYSQETYLHTLPLCHVGGLVMWLTMLQTNSTHVLMPKYGPDQLLTLVAEHAVTALIAVPAIVIDLLNSRQVASSKFQSPHPQQRPKRLVVHDTRSTPSLQGQASYTSVQHILLGGGALHAVHHEPLRCRFPQAAVWTTYGMTECTSSIATVELGSQKILPRYGLLVGHPLEGIQVAIGSDRVQTAPAHQALSAPAGESHLLVLAVHSVLGQ